ncbi:MAG: hypothetical protein ACRD2X_01960 [Vicinamibacteraceae bacterium]
MLERLRTAWPLKRPLGRHLASDELLRVALTGQDRRSPSDAPRQGVQSPESADAASLSHLAACEVCQQRADRQQSALTDFADAARDTLDELFSTNRVERQLSAVMRRLDGGQPRGRVLVFPGRAGVRFRPTIVSRRWIAAAAAAGLFLGLVTGQFVSLERAAGFSVPRAAAPRPSSPASTAPVRASADEGEALLFEVDAALTSLGSPELRALDDLTPRVSATFVSAQYRGR